MYVQTGSILVLYTEQQLPCNCQTFNNAVRVYYSPFNVFKYTINYFNTVFKCINIRIYKYIDKYTYVFEYCPTLDIKAQVGHATKLDTQNQDDLMLPF